MSLIQMILLKLSGMILKGFIGRGLNMFSPSSYMARYIKFLEKCGLKIQGTPNYISPDVYFDSHDYSKITLMDGCVLSKEVFLLTHDYSIARGIEALQGKDWDKKQTPHFLKEIYVGENSFVGARTMLLPGTHIGKNCIIGAGSVVKGVIPDNSIVVGNPAKVIAKTDEWAQKHIEKHDFLP